VETVVRKSEDSRDELLNKVRSVGTAYRRHKAARDTVQVNRLWNVP
jgi:hypothetical protein